MGTYKQQGRATRNQRRAHGSPGTGRHPANETLSNLQTLADRSQPVQQLRAYQHRASLTLQREVDTSRSPSLGRGVEDYKYPLPASDKLPGWADKGYGKPAYDEKGVLKNDPADGAPGWAQEEYRKKVGKTGTVDTSSSPRLPDVAPGEKPGWQNIDPTGVPKWAKDEYKEEAPRTLIASVADGKIGSIYFPDGRIRTTHGKGPTKSKHGQTLQYNIDFDAAAAEFAKKNPKLYRRFLNEGLALAEKDPSITRKEVERAASKAYFHEEAKYIAKRLNVPNPSKMPAFVRLVTRGRKLPSWAGEAIKSPDDAPGMDVATDGKLFEVFRKINGRVEGWHPSRGAAKKWETNKQVVSVLEAAIKHLKDQKIKGAKKRNAAFYDFILHRIPSFAAQIRKPDEV
ncbi:hypothetical protein [Roseobacter denitrificans]|uniref:Uncharacterized protein n=1 Tax=Roseobacter denitrificans (strain ATCC 33942 / OCh 114) TaxID=375451 RepID=Q16AC1_ROSDO|nr:hypothetical protein [Roseobacter denitrificans]ABG31072.1 hypothetical protein RD1_1434 [Roseobacter denitrificans OCh 114]SFG33336.1 hypothetical protein SAMN05443635_113100 [Roseobacter denitrificans OCh 114]